MATPTSGPWHVATSFTDGDLEPHYSVMASEFKTLASIVPHDDPEANARLIAAAPDLLTAAHAAFHALKSYEFGNAAPDLARNCAAALEEAIAKAEGRFNG